MARVFISWSGELSGEIAEAISEWLPNVLQEVKPYRTFSDIEKGEKWNSDIVTELEYSRIGIICLTEENLVNPWILLEYYALSKNPNTQVCPLIFGINPPNLPKPFAGVATIFKKSDFKKLVESINEKCIDRQTPDVFNPGFDDNWKDLENKIEGILKSTSNRSHSGVLEGLVCGYRSLKDIVHKDDDENLRNAFEKMQKSLDVLESISCDAGHKKIWDTYREVRKMTIMDSSELIGNTE